MKKSQLVKEAEKLGLLVETGNHWPDCIAQIWTPHNSENKIKSTDGKMYSVDLLSLKEISDLNQRFVKLIDFCIKNNLAIRDIHHIESNLISEIVVVVKKSILDNVESKSDFELDDTLTNSKEEKYTIPTPVYNTAAASLFGEKLTKSELAKVEEFIEERMAEYTVEDNVFWMLNICLYSNYFNHIKKVFESNLMTPEVFVYNLFYNTDLMFYEGENEFTKLLSLLTEYPIDLVSLTHSSDRRGYLPSVMTSNKKIMKNVFANWTFTENTTQRIFDYLIGDELEDIFVSFIKTYKPCKLNFETNIEQLLINDIFTLNTLELYFSTWVNFKDYDVERVIDVMNMFIADARRDTKVKGILITTIIRAEIVPLEEVYKNLVSTMSALKYNSITNDRHKFLLQHFLKDNTLDYTFTNCFIVKVYFDVPAQKAKFLANPKIVDALVADGDDYYLPDSVKEIFLF